MVRILLSHHANPLHKRSFQRDGKNSIQVATEANHTECAKFLLTSIKREAERLRDLEGRIVELMGSVRHPSLNSKTGILLDLEPAEGLCRVSVVISDRRRRTYHVAPASVQPLSEEQAMDRVLSADKSMSTDRLCQATSKDALREMSILLASGVDPNQPHTKTRDRPLAFSASGSNTCFILLAARADPLQESDFVHDDNGQGILKALQSLHDTESASEQHVLDQICRAVVNDDCDRLASLLHVFEPNLNRRLDETSKFMKRTPLGVWDEENGTGVALYTLLAAGADPFVIIDGWSLYRESASRRFEDEFYLWLFEMLDELRGLLQQQAAWITNPERGARWLLGRMPLEEEYPIMDVAFDVRDLIQLSVSDIVGPLIALIQEAHDPIISAHRMLCRLLACVAAESDDEAAVMQLLDVDASWGELENWEGLNAIDDDKRSPLWYAAANGNARLLEELLARGAAFNRLDDGNESPLGTACFHGHRRCAEILLQVRADVDGAFRGNTFTTPLMLACEMGQAECVELLLRHRANPNIYLLQFASGLKWEVSGTHKPTKGTELTNKKLVEALRSKTDFTEDEWGEFGIEELNTTHYIKSGARFFKPAESREKKNDPATAWELAACSDIAGAYVCSEKVRLHIQEDNMVAEATGKRFKLKDKRETKDSNDAKDKNAGLSAEVAQSELEALRLKAGLRDGDVAWLSRWLRDGGREKVNSSPVVDGMWALTAAAGWGHGEVVRRLLKVASPDPPADERGDFPLLLSCSVGSEGELSIAV